ncbi:MAG: hypothetical protein Q7U57_09635 [Methylovulum sp.]|nr:hypothetical protein [Methylovulum sp.]
MQNQTNNPTKSVIIYGPQGSEKPKYAARMLEYFGLTTVNEDWYPGDALPDGTLALTDMPNAEGARLLSEVIAEMDEKDKKQNSEKAWAERMARMMLEDLTYKLEKYGEDSEHYKKQQQTAGAMIRGSLLEILAAAIAYWDQNQQKQTPELELNPEKIICTECRYYQKLENDYRIYEVCNHSQARNIINGGPRSCDYMRTVICGQRGALFERPAVIDARL